MYLELQLDYRGFFASCQATAGGNFFLSPQLRVS